MTMFVEEGIGSSRWTSNCPPKGFVDIMDMTLLTCELAARILLSPVEEMVVEVVVKSL